MNHSVHLTIDAERDLLECCRYAATNDSPSKARRLLDTIEKTINGLTTITHQGKGLASRTLNSHNRQNYPHETSKNQL